MDYLVTKEPTAPSRFRRKLVAAAMMLAAIVGCSDPDATTAGGDGPAGDDDRIELVMIPKATQQTFWGLVRSGAERAAEEFDVDLQWKGPARDNDRGEQKRVLQQFATTAIDGILLAPTDSVALAADVKTAAGKGIPVVIFDSAIEAEPGTDYVTFVATDNFAAGKMGGKRLMELAGAGGKAVLFRHMEGHASTGAREEGALEEFHAADADVLSENQYSGQTVSEAQTKAINMIDVIEEADGIFASNQTAAEGLLLGLRQRNLAGKIKFVGFDSSPLLRSGLENGEIDALIVQDPANMGYTAVKLMVEHLRGEDVETEVLTDARIITRDDLDDPAIAPLFE